MVGNRLMRPVGAEPYQYTRHKSLVQSQRQSIAWQRLLHLYDWSKWNADPETPLDWLIAKEAAEQMCKERGLE